MLLTSLGKQYERSWKHRVCLPHRYKLAIFAAVGLAVIIGSSTSFALVMTHLTSYASFSSENIIFPNCTTFNTSRDLSVDMGGDTMFLLHTAYLAGLSVGKLPGGVLATLFSPKQTVAVSVLFISSMTLFVHLVIPVNTPLLFVLRTVQGLIEAFQQPATLGMLSAWSTSTDNARLTSIYLAGCGLAPVVSLILTGSALCYVGWNTIFYLYGTLGVTWCVMWMMKFYDKPDLHPRLSAAEREQHTTHGASVGSGSKLFQRTLWRSILTSRAVWAIVVGSFSRNLVFSLMIFEQPQYFLDAFKLKIADIGLMSTLPYVGLSITCTLGGLLSDKLLSLGLGKTSTRKLAFTLGLGIESLSLVGLYFTSDWRTAIVLLSLGIASGGFSYSGYLPLPSEIAPQYAALISGVAMLGTLGGVFSTLLASFLTGITRTLEDWQRMFLIMGIIQILAIIIFDIFATAELQPWAHGIIRQAPEKKDVTEAPASSSGQEYEETTLLADEYSAKIPTYLAVAYTDYRAKTTGDELKIEDRC